MSDDAYGGPMPTPDTSLADEPLALHNIRAAVDAVEDAETQLEEVTALVALERMVARYTRQSIDAALSTHNIAQVARAAGVTRQAMRQRKRPTKP